MSEPVFKQNVKSATIASLKSNTLLILLTAALITLVSLNLLAYWPVEIDCGAIRYHLTPIQLSKSTMSNGVDSSESGFEGLLKNVKITSRTKVAEKKCTSVKGRRILINYAANCCRLAQKENCRTGLEIGGFDICVSFSDMSLDVDFKERQAEILKKPTGAGLWTWKPYIIFRTLLAMRNDDVLLYSDSGCKFIRNMDLGHVCLQANLNQDIVLFAYEAPEIRFSKADAFFLINCNIADPACSNTSQFLGSPILLRKSAKSLQFVTEWLTYTQDYRIIGNEFSVFKKDSIKDFEANRNDQTVLSLVAKKWKINPWPDPSQWGENSFGQSLRSQTKFSSISQTFMDLTRQKF